MVYGAIDLHMRSSQIRIIDDVGVVVRDQSVPTTRERVTHAFASHGPMRILLETGTESEWVAQVLEAAGHEVIVADPNYAPMYGREVTRRIKTDRRDVAALAEANRRGWYRRAHRSSPVQRETKQILRSRRFLVQARSGAVRLLRSLLRQSGYRLGTGSCETVPARLARLTLPSSPRRWHRCAGRSRRVTTEIHAIDARLQTRTASDAIVARLRSVPGVGLIVATNYVAPSSIGVSASATPARSVPPSAWSRAKIVPRSAAIAATLRTAAARAAQSADSSGVGLLAPWRQWHAPGVGGSPRRTARSPHCGRGVSAPIESHSVCALA